MNASTNLVLTREQYEQYHRDGFLYLEKFYDLERDILPIQRDIHRLISLIIKVNNLSVTQKEFSPADFDSGLPELLRDRRDLVSVLYDAVKKIPSYTALACDTRHELVVRALLGSDFVGYANRGYGIRMDNPSEDVHMTQWHQDYTSQLCAPSGIVFWSPLRDVDELLGPVEFCPGSHREGILRIIREQEGSRGLLLEDEETLVRKYVRIKPQVKTGDAVLTNYLVLHRSSPNRSRATRWAMISRYFDFLDKTGMSYGWKGGLQEGNSFEKIHPELSEVKNTATLN